MRTLTVAATLILILATPPAAADLAAGEPGMDAQTGMLEPAGPGLATISDILRTATGRMNPDRKIRVIITLQHQPQDLISKQVCELHAEEMDEIRQRVKSINTGYSLSRNTGTSRDAENYLDPALLMSTSDRADLRQAAEDHEALSLEILDEINRRLRDAVEADRQKVRAALEQLGAEVEFGMVSINALVATVPVSSLEEIVAIDGVAWISEDGRTEAQLDTAAHATRVIDTGGLWESGFDGGLYDPAVLDTGADLAHPGLADSATRSNFNAFHLSAAAGDPDFDDVFSVEDIHGHGTHVLGIVASMGTSYYPALLGMANGLEKAVTLKAGFRTTSGLGSMHHSDAMFLVDRALYDTDSLVPYASFNDDVDGLNLSFGGPAYSDQTYYSLFYDSIVSSYPDLTVTLSAGNTGPDNTAFTSPACAYNPITVANVDDGGTPDRIDDLISESSTRGPTFADRRKPDLAAPGADISSCNNEWETEYDFVEKSGTSMAAPMVLGVAMDLMEAGVTDELELKALLINTAQKNDGVIDFEDDEDGWDPAYGWGYINALAAFYHRVDLFSGSVTPDPDPGHCRLYKGRMRDEGPAGEGRDRATLVWNRHVTYNPADYPFSFHNLSNLDLFLFAEADNTLIESDESERDNVAQVRIGSGAADTDVVVVVEASETGFHHGGDTEAFALATEEGFVEIDSPYFLFTSSSIYPWEMEPNEEADFYYILENNGELTSHINRLELVLPPGWVLVSGSELVSLGSIAGGGGSGPTAIWRLRAQPTEEEDVLVDVDHSHYSYHQRGGMWVTFPFNVDIRWDTVPPDPATAWDVTPHAVSSSAIAMSCTPSSDLHDPVTYFFDMHLNPTGGAGGTDSGWISGTAYTDHELSPNHQYHYRVKARDNAQTPNETAYTADVGIYTLANPMGTPSVTSPTESTLRVSIPANGNPSHTQCAILVEEEGGGNWYLDDEGGSNGSTPFWQNLTAWGSSIVATGLAGDMQYGFSLLARNGNGIEADWSGIGYGTTSAPFGPTITVSITCNPSSGTLPFTTQMTVTLQNLYPDQIRRVAGRINLLLANDSYISNWRAGYTNIAGGETYTSCWNTSLPTLGSLVGENTFRLTAEDVTPAPYNQPPYPPSGSTDDHACLVVANAP